jgi:acetylornithine deacetylase/succinyl-diaminopimelate desuccinylase-like protein
LWALAGAAARLEVSPGGAATLLRVIRELFAGDHLGARLGLAYQHPIMGPLVVAPTLLRADARHATLQVNMRRPDGLASAAFGERLDRALAGIRATIDARVVETPDRYVGNPVYTSPDSPRVKLLLDIFHRTTGDHAARPISVRGGTYARLFPGGVNFGPVMPGEPSLAHATDEAIRVSTLAALSQMVLEVALLLPELPADPP